MQFRSMQLFLQQRTLEYRIILWKLNNPYITRPYYNYTPRNGNRWPQKKKIDRNHNVFWNSMGVL